MITENNRKCDTSAKIGYADISQITVGKAVFYERHPNVTNLICIGHYFSFLHRNICLTYLM